MRQTDLALRGRYRTHRGSHERGHRDEQSRVTHQQPGREVVIVGKQVLEPSVCSSKQPRLHVAVRQAGFFPAALRRRTGAVRRFQPPPMPMPILVPGASSPLRAPFLSRLHQKSTKSRETCSVSSGSKYLVAPRFRPLPPGFPRAERRMGGGGEGESREPQCREMVKRKRTKRIVDGSEGSNHPPPTTHTSKWCRPHMEETRRVSSFGP